MKKQIHKVLLILNQIDQKTIFFLESQKKIIKCQNQKNFKIFSNLRSKLGSFILSSPKSHSHNNSANEQFVSKFQLTNLKLKILEKCSEKMFANQQQKIFYEDLIEQQKQTNSILQRINPETILKAQQLSSQNNAKNSQFCIRSRKSSQNLISSWTAFQNLDITYKTKEQQLIKQNNLLHYSILILQNKLKSLYPQSYVSSEYNNDLEQNLNQLQLSKAQPAKSFRSSNLHQIQKRIATNQQLLQRMKLKINKKKQEKQLFREKLEQLIKNTTEKFGKQVGQIVRNKFKLKLL